MDAKSIIDVFQKSSPKSHAIFGLIFGCRELVINLEFDAIESLTRSIVKEMQLQIFCPKKDLTLM